MSASDLRELNNPPVLAVIGVGYVGEHLVYALSSSFEVIGYDVSQSRLEKLRSGNHQLERIKFTSNVEDLRIASHFLISVPTTLRLDGSVDLSNIENALEVIERYARRGSIVIESTVAVGTTRRPLEPLARSRGILRACHQSELIPAEFRLLLTLSQKLYENCQRTITIAYANEMADTCVPFGVDPFEVAKTAATKPFGYLPIFPPSVLGVTAY